MHRSPTVLVAPDKYNLRYTGAPLGEEGRSLLVAILMASTGQEHPDGAVVKKIAGLKEKRDIQVFVTPTCPYCPQQALTAFSAAIVKPDLISAEVVEMYENPDLAESARFHVRAADAHQRHLHRHRAAARGTVRGIAAHA